ncbi:MAG: urate hydroxylase PuuD, partial [Proteobacteria bacterium]|nr:urate hydroxylase PuuD [Pseudomonadota bacterium]
MDFNIDSWLNLAIRWFHVMAGIMWIGTSFFFIWL